MKKLLCAIILLFAGWSLLGQEAIEVDGALQCPYYISVESGGQYTLSCPATGYIIVWAGVTYPSNIQYSVNNGATWSSNYEFYNLVQGSYNVKIKANINGQECIVDYPYNPVKVTYKDYVTQYWNPNSGHMVTMGKSLIDTVTVVAPTDCAGLGSLEVTPIGNTSSFEYSLDGVNFQFNNKFKNLPIGRYHVYVRQSGMSCVIEYRHEVVIYPKSYIKDFEYSYTRTCSGYNLTLTATFPSAVEYSINNGVTWQSSDFFPNVQPGYYVLLCRKSGCIYTPENNLLTLTSIKPQIFNVQSTQAACGSPGILSFILAHQRDKYNYLEYEASTDNVNYTVLSGNLSPATMSVPQGVTRIYLKVKWLNSTTGLLESCTYYFDIPVTLGTLAAPVVNAMNPQCNQTNGSITILPFDAHYRYSIDNGNTWSGSNVFSNLGPATYQIQIKTIDDLCFSPKINQTLVNENIPPIINGATVQQLSDCGVDDGKITISYTAGTGSPLFSIDNGSNWAGSNVFSGLAANNYFLKIKNSNNSCPVDYSGNPVVINPLLPPQITAVTTQNISDCGVSDGKITITAIPGTAPVQYSIDNGSSWNDSGIFSGLAPGSYQVKARNNTGNCIVSWSGNPVVLTSPLPPVLQSVTVTGLSDCGSNNGQIVIQAQQGSAPTEYSINNGTSWQATGTFSNLTPGNYNVKVRNNNNTCVVSWPSNPVTVTTPTPAVIQSVTVTGLSDCGSNDGQIVIQAQQGSAPTEYSINNGTSWQATGTFSNLTPGNYNVRVRNNNSTCVVSWPNNPVTITTPTPAVIQSVTSANTSDCNLNDGLISIQVTPGSSSPAYSIDNGVTWQSSGNFGGLAPGSYFVRVKNSNGTCIVTWSGNPVQIGGHTAPAIIAVQTIDVSDCGLTDGRITVAANPGEGGILYSVNDGSTWSTSPIFANLSGGTYTVKVKNSNGTCIVPFAQNPVIINQPIAPVFLNVMSTNVSDCNLSDGKITISAQQGNGAVQYSIDDGITWSSSGNFNGLSAAVYFLKIRNQNNTCIVLYPQNPVIITGPTAPVIQSVIKSDATECNVNDGSITVNASPGSNAVTFSINNGASWHSSGIFTGLGQGTYYVVVRNDDGTCVVNYQANPVVIFAPSSPSITSLVVEQPVDCDDNKGGITILYNPGSGSPQFTIDGGQTWHNSPVFSDVLVGTYFPGIRNSDGSCSSISTSPVVIAAIQLPVIHAVTTDGLIGCTSGLVSVFIQASGQTGYTLQYSIDDGVTWQSGSGFSNLSAGTYRIKVRYQQGICEVSYAANPLILNVIPPPDIVDVTVTQPVSCSNPATGSIGITGSDANSLALQYSINNGQTWTNNPSFQNLTSGIYHILIRNSLGCVTSWPGNPLTLSAPSQPVISSVDIVKLPDCSKSNGALKVNYSATTGVEMSIDNGLHWQADPLFSGLAKGSYAVLIRNDDGHCQNVFAGNPLILGEIIDFSVINVVLSHPTECDATDGRIDILTEPATGSFEYSIDNGITYSGQKTFTGLDAGNYRIKVRRSGTDCIFDYSQTVTLIAPDAPGFENIVINQPGCSDATGSIWIISSTSDVRYSIDGGITWQESGLFSGLADGIYHPALSNTDGSCLILFPEIVELTYTVPFRIDKVVASDNADCVTPDGSIDIQANQSGLLYSIDDGLTWTTNAHFGGLSGGSYRIAVRDPQSGCVVHYPVPVNVGSDVSITIASVDYRSTANCDRLPAFIRINTLDDGLQYSVDGGINWTSENYFSPLTSGIYYIAVRKDGCVTFGDTLVFEPFAQLKLDRLDFQMPSACSELDGMLQIFCPGATGFSIDGGNNYVPDAKFSGLDGGIYSIYVQSGQGCAFDLGQLPLYADATGLLDSLLASQPEDCVSSDGSIVIYPSSQHLGLQFSIDYGESWTSDTVFTGLGAHDYWVLVRDESSQCTLMWPTTIHIIVKNVPHIDSISIHYLKACEDGFGVLDIYPALTGHLFSIDNGVSWQGVGHFDQVKDGEYIVLILDTLSNCLSVPDTVRLNNSVPDLSLSAIASAVSSCDANDGSFVFEKQPDIETSIDFGLSWQHNAGYYGLKPGRYNMLVRNTVNGCQSSSLAFNIGWPGFDPDAIVIEHLDAYCGRPVGSFDIKAEAGLLFSIDKGVAWSENTRYESLLPGSYEVIIKKGEKCLFSPGFPVEIANRDSIDYLVTAQPPTCKGMDDGSVSLSFSDNIQPMVIWDNQNNAYTRPGGAGEYLFEIKYGTCEEQHFASIPESTVDNIFWHPVGDTVLCNSGNVVYSLADTFQYEWYVNRAFWADGPSVSIPTPSEVRLVISDDRGCVLNDRWKMQRSEVLYDFDFLLPSEGLIHFPVIAVDISSPIPDNIVWSAESSEKETDKVLANQYHVVFGSPGTYSVEAHYVAGDCEEVVKKQVRIFASRDSLQFPLTGITGRVIASLTLTPNPNNGSFRLIAEYFDIQPGQVFIYNAAGKQVYSQRLTPQYALEETPIALTGLRPGVYSLIYLADTGEFHWINFIIVQ